MQRLRGHPGCPVPPVRRQGDGLPRAGGPRAALSVLSSSPWQRCKRSSRTRFCPRRGRALVLAVPVDLPESRRPRQGCVQGLGQRQRCDSLLPASLTPMCCWWSSLLEATFSLWATCVVVFFFVFPLINVTSCLYLGRTIYLDSHVLGALLRFPFSQIFFKVFLKHCVLVVLGLHCHSQAFSGASAWGLSSWWCLGLSLRWPLLWSSGSRLRDSRGAGSVVTARGHRSVGSVAVVHRLSCPVACGIVPVQGWNSCLLRWQADS